METNHPSAVSDTSNTIISTQVESPAESIGRSPPPPLAPSHAQESSPVTRQDTAPPSSPGLGKLKGSYGKGKDDYDSHGDTLAHGHHRNQWFFSLPSGIVMFMMIIACAITVIGTAGSQYFGDVIVLQPVPGAAPSTVAAIPATVHLYLYKAVFVHRDGNERIYSRWYRRGAGRHNAESFGLSSTNTTFVYPMGFAEGDLFSEDNYTMYGYCPKVHDEYAASFAFSIMACVACFVAGICALFRICGRKTISKWAVVGTSFAAFAFLVITFSLSIDNYTARNCGARSLKDRGHRINFGLALLVAAAGLSLLSSLWAAVTK